MTRAAQSEEPLSLVTRRSGGSEMMTETGGKNRAARTSLSRLEKRFWSVLLFVSSAALTRRLRFFFLWHRKPSLRDLALHLNSISSHHHNLKKGTTLRGGGGGGGAVKRRINFPFLFLSPSSQRCTHSLFPFLEKVFSFPFSFFAWRQQRTLLLLTQSLEGICSSLLLVAPPPPPPTSRRPTKLNLSTPPPTSVASPLLLLRRIKKCQMKTGSEVLDVANFSLLPPLFSCFRQVG